MKTTSLKQNVMLSGVQKLFSIIFPLITFPYISRVLQVSTIGKVDFSTSMISYFTLIAGLGITNYAVREGAKVKYDKEKLEKLCAELFTINMLSTIVAYILLAIIYMSWSKMSNYALFLFIGSFNIVGTTIGINWLYSIYEDYVYITVRTVAFQILSLVLMFLCVKSDGDGSKYMCISVVSATGMNILNLIHSRKYIKLRLTTKINFRKHIKPIMIIFASSVAITIYVNSDVTILGWLKDDYEVGIYSIAVKFYNIFKQLVVAMIMVALPRVSSYVGNQEIDKYKETTANLFSFLFAFTVPIVVGLIMVANIIIPIVAGESYMPSVRPLQILSLSLLFAVASTFATYALILPNRLEKVQLIATIASSIVNIGLNFILIPKCGASAAAFTTFISEVMVFAIEAVAFKKNDNLGISEAIFKLKWNTILSTVIGAIYILIVTKTIGKMNISLVGKLILDVIISFVGYVGILIVLKNEGLKFLKNTSPNVNADSEKMNL